MRTKTISFGSILTRKKIKGFYASALAVFALSCAAFCLTAINRPSEAREAKNLRGAEAVEQLKQNGQYDSLMEAFKAARREERGQTDANSLTAPEVISRTAKLFAPDGAPANFFGYSVALSGDTAIVGALFDDVGANANQGSAYVFTRSGTIWTQQQQLLSSNGAAGDEFGASVAINIGTILVSRIQRRRQR